MRHKIILASVVASIAITPFNSGAYAHTHEIPVNDQGPMQQMQGGHTRSIAGVTGDNMPVGAWMFNYQPMYMHMEGNRIGTSNVSPEFIVTNVANPNAPPPNLRVVPTDMDIQMHMFMAMYAPTDWLTVMAMTSYNQKEMNHITFQGAAGITPLGIFNTQSSGLGDTSLNAIIKAFDDGRDKLQVSAGLSLPTGSITETDTVLAPTGATPTLRLPYAMQLGSGTYDLLPAVTWRRSDGPWSFGARYSGVIRLGNNDQGYSFGDIHNATTWAAYQWNPMLNTSLRIAARSEGRISGADPLIAAPVQTADPSNYGGERIDLMFGINFAGQGAQRGTQLALEVGAPIYQNLNGPQMELDYTARISLVKMLMP